MSKGGGKVVYDPDKLLEYRKRFDELYNEFWGYLAQGSFVKSENDADKEPVKLDLDVSRIVFYQKNQTQALANASWGWCFAYTREGGYHPESRALVQAIEQYGKVVVGDREYELGGRDGKLLQMRRPKK